MSDILQDAATWLAGKQKSFLAQTITYTRGNDSVEITAMAAKSTYQVDNGHGIIEEVTLQDFIIDAADLIIDDIEILPQRDDIIEWGVAGVATRFLVCGMPGVPPFQRDAYRGRLRIHTKEIEAAP